MARYETSSSSLDEAERSWWSAHGEVEDRYCWVQGPEERRILRGRYVAVMARAIPAGGRVLEVGCGTGWLSRLIAERSGAEVVGTDFAPEQLERARAATPAHLAGRVSFLDTEAAAALGEAFDVVVMHAFLHHLSAGEIKEALEGAAAHLRPGGRLVALEPVHHDGPPVRLPVELAVLRRLVLLPRWLAWRRLRRERPAERDVRRELAAREVGTAPCGPSPKELPFGPDELTALLRDRFVVERRVPSLSVAHLVAQEVLVAGLSQPRLWAAARLPLLRLAAALDRRLLRRPPHPSVWVFELFVARRR